MYRDHTKTVHIGNKVIGGGNPILIQSMTNTRTEDVKVWGKMLFIIEGLSMYLTAEENGKILKIKLLQKSMQSSRKNMII